LVSKAVQEIVPMRHRPDIARTDNRKHRPGTVMTTGYTTAAGEARRFWVADDGLPDG